MRIGEVEAHYPLRNALASPREFFGEPSDLAGAFRDMHQRGFDLVAIYHSHPTTAAIPSRTDLEQNFYGTAVMHLIMSFQRAEPKLRAWMLGPDQATEAQWILVDGSA